MTLFPLGNLYATPGVLKAVPQEEINKAIERHSNGDWGDLCKEDKQENEFSLKNGFRLLSSYTSKDGVKFWIITEADRSATTVLLPDEY